MEETLKFIQEHRFDDVRKLAFASHPADIDLHFALSQIAGRQAMKTKIPSWYESDNIIYPKHLSLEQCSSEATAKYKASLVSGDSLIDLTGGFGVDCAFVAQKFKTAIYVERSEYLCVIAGKNFNTLELSHVRIIHGESDDYLDKISKVDCIYLDPARRDGVGEKTIAIQDCEPNILELKEQLLSKAGMLMIKLSPMLDISLALQSLPETKEIHVVSVAGECKELIFILKATFSSEPVLNCINILKNDIVQDFSFLKSEEQCTINYTSKPESYIYEPNASVLKAGAYKIVASRFNLEKLHPDSHLYTSNHLVENFPGRIFKFISVFSFNKKEIKENLVGIKQANITIRNFPGSVNELRKKLKLKEGGDIYLFATTLYNGKRVLLITSKINGK